MKNSKILMLPFSHTLSHISRLLELGRELRRRGHEVIFAGEGNHLHYCATDGFAIYPLIEPDPKKLFDNIRKKKLSFIETDSLEALIKADLDLFKKVKPDLVLSDGRFSAGISCRSMGLPHGAIVNVSSTAYRALPYVPMFEWLPFPKGSPVWNYIYSLNLKIEMLVFNQAMSAFSKLSRKYQAKPAVTATDCLCGTKFTLLPDIPEYFPTKNLPDNYHYIGPLTWKSNLPAPCWWPPAKKEKGLIYLTMGTTGIEDFFQKAYEVLKSSEFTAVMTTAGQTEELKNISDKLYLEEYADGDLIMEACDVVVCQGGNGTIYQALMHGKPIIGIPSIPDQAFNMRRVQALGAGVSFDQKEFDKDPQTLLEKIRQIQQTPSFAKKAREVQSILKTYQSKKLGADITERYLISYDYKKKKGGV